MRNTKTRKTYLGTVISDKTDKTISVQMDTYKAHKLYGKRVKYSKKFAVHDEKNEAKIGDTVLIMSTKPFSKTKNFRLIEIKKVK
ncbi:MAG: 30S ribosomal protein S17 [Mycoplasmataceae bacterium]|nr:30S ribosomal protein S17 [Mycoplasmataceae bacterium]